MEERSLGVSDFDVVMLLRYLSNELAAMNVTVRLELEHLGAPVEAMGEVSRNQLRDKAEESVKRLVEGQQAFMSPAKRQEPRQTRAHAA